MLPNFTPNNRIIKLATTHHHGRKEVYNVHLDKITNWIIGTNWNGKHTLRLQLHNESGRPHGNRYYWRNTNLPTVHPEEIKKRLIRAAALYAHINKNIYVKTVTESYELELIRDAVREKSKRIPLGQMCEGCGWYTTKLQRHHTDYNKSEWIIILCVFCHQRLHGHVQNQQFIKYKKEHNDNSPDSSEKSYLQFMEETRLQRDTELSYKEWRKEKVEIERKNLPPQLPKRYIRSQTSYTNSAP